MINYLNPKRIQAIYMAIYFTHANFTPINIKHSFRNPNVLLFGYFIHFTTWLFLSAMFTLPQTYLLFQPF